MKTAYFDCFGGAAGDMTVASLLDAGVELPALRRELTRLGLDGEFSIRSSKVSRCGLAGTWLDVRLAAEDGHAHDHDHEHAHGHDHGHKHEHNHGHEHEHDHDHGHSHDHEHEHHHGHGHEHEHSHDHEHPHEHSHDHDHDHEHAHGHEHGHGDHGHSHGDHAHVHGRNLPDILALLDKADFPPRADQRIRRIFRRLAAAEAAAHGVSVEEVHFHEVGAVDSIVDIVGAVLALELLDVERVVCSPIPLGSGTVRCAHGIMPVPAPATAELMRDGAIAASDARMELCTPTGAAIMTTLAESFTPALPELRVEAIGYGAGTRELPDRPNMMRVFIGEPAGAATADTVIELAANIDDSTGQEAAAALEALMLHGALDAWIAPVTMKKSRPGLVLSALCRTVDAARLERIFFTETTTLGVRRSAATRTCLQREFATVETHYGEVRIKLARLDGEIVTARAEFEDCRAAADAHHQSVRRVAQAALDAWRERQSTD